MCEHLSGPRIDTLTNSFLPCFLLPIPFFLLLAFVQAGRKLGINVISSARGPMVTSLNDEARHRGVKKGDVLIEVDGRDITGLSGPEIISLFRNTKAKHRVVTIRRSRRSGVM